MSLKPFDNVNAFHVMEKWRTNIKLYYPLLHDNYIKLLKDTIEIKTSKIALAPLGMLQWMNKETI